jgi:hypothetical protein
MVILMLSSTFRLGCGGYEALAVASVGRVLAVLRMGSSQDQRSGNRDQKCPALLTTSIVRQREIILCKKRRPYLDFLLCAGWCSWSPTSGAIKCAKYGVPGGAGCYASGSVWASLPRMASASARACSACFRRLVSLYTAARWLRVVATSGRYASGSDSASLR